MKHLKPGIKIDLLIAEHVMGAEWVLRDNEQPEACPYLQHDHFVCYPKINRKAMRHNSSYGSYIGAMPAYSQYIGPAWDVIEKIYEDTNHWILVGRIRKNKYVAYQSTGCADEDYGDWCNYAETAPHAICLTALQAKGII